MTLNTSVRNPAINLIAAPRIIVVTAILSIIIEDVFKWSLPYLVSAEIVLLVRYDVARRDLLKCLPFLSLATAFSVFYCIFLVSEIWS